MMVLVLQGRRLKSWKSSFLELKHGRYTRHTRTRKSRNFPSLKAAETYRCLCYADFLEKRQNFCEKPSIAKGGSGWLIKLYCFVSKHPYREEQLKTMATFTTAPRMRTLQNSKLPWESLTNKGWLRLAQDMSQNVTGRLFYTTAFRNCSHLWESEQWSPSLNLSEWFLYLRSCFIFLIIFSSRNARWLSELQQYITNPWNPK